jgi:hypothetical protein
LCLRERLAPQASDLEGDFHNTTWIEGIEALEGIEEMPHGGGKTSSKVLTGDDLKKQPLGCAVWGMV